MLCETIPQLVISGTTEQSVLGSTQDTHFRGTRQYEAVQANAYLGGGRLVFRCEDSADRTVRVKLGGVQVFERTQMYDVDEIGELVWLAKVLAISGGYATVGIFLPGNPNEYEEVGSIPLDADFDSNFLAVDVTLQNNASVDTTVLLHYIN